MFLRAGLARGRKEVVMAQPQCPRDVLTQNCEASLGVIFASQTPRPLRGRIAASLLLAVLCPVQPSVKFSVTLRALRAFVCVGNGGGTEQWVPMRTLDSETPVFEPWLYHTLRTPWSHGCVSWVHLNRKCSKAVVMHQTVF